MLSGMPKAFHKSGEVAGVLAFAIKHPEVQVAALPPPRLVTLGVT